jgi:hypothetical protein
MERKNQIIDELYRSKELNECVKKYIKPVEIQNDIIQVTFLELLEKPDEFIIDLYTRNKLKQYVINMMYNQLKWQRSSYKKTLQKELSVFEFIDIPEEIAPEKIIIPLHKLNWYDAKMLELYAEHKSYRKIEAETGIEYSGICKTIQKVRKEIIKHIENEN